MDDPPRAALLMLLMEVVTRWTARPLLQQDVVNRATELLQSIQEPASAGGYAGTAVGLCKGSQEARRSAHLDGCWGLCCDEARLATSPQQLARIWQNKFQGRFGYRTTGLTIPELHTACAQTSPVQEVCALKHEQVREGAGAIMWFLPSGKALGWGIRYNMLEATAQKLFPTLE